MNFLKYLPPSIALFVFGFFLSRDEKKQARENNGMRPALIPICRNCRK